MTMDFQQARFNMVEQQIRPWDVLDQGVLDALLQLQRDAFVPEAYRQLAYSDTRIPLGGGKFMMTPKLEARMVQALALKGTDRVLEIGTGSGYVTALLARFARSVLSLELDAEAAAEARRKLRAHGVVNASVVVGDGLVGSPDNGPFDAIAVTGALTVRNPALEAQLAVGGRLFAVIGQGHAMPALLITRVSETAFTAEALFETELEPLVGAEPKPAFRF